MHPLRRPIIRQLAPVVGDPSPWGTIQLSEPLGSEGVRVVSTARHGGVWVPRELFPRIPEPWRRWGERWAHGWGPGWYEEDLCAVGALRYLGLAAPGREEECVAACARLEEQYGLR